jgi:O-antigen biosynthesis protein
LEKVTVLIPTYYGGQMVLNCVNSLLTNVPNVKFAIFKNDIGWLKACNELIEGTTGDVILLNDDTIVLTDIVYEMQTLAYSEETIGIVGGKSLMTNSETILNYGIYVSPDGNTAHKYYGKPKDSVEVEYQKAVEGSCIYIKRELIDSIGVFDENFGMGYREEIDYCFRAREAGWKIVSCPTAEYIHFTSQTNGKLGIKNDTHKYFMSKWGTKLKLGLV